MEHIQRYTLLLPILLMPLLCVGATSSHAATEKQLITGAKLCTRYINRYERKYAIPTHLLSAIATTESGRYHKGLKISIPWPWTINVKGKGYYFNTKKEAVHAVRKYRARGIKSIDVGCMQVNLYHHAKAFRSIEEAFEPKYNVAYAASFLRRLYKDSKSWKTAAGHYHSKTRSRSKKYAGNVYQSWHKIIAKLRAARLRSVQPTRTVASVSKPLTARPTRKIVALPKQKSRPVATHRTPRMKVIELAQNKKPSRATVIVKPAIRVVNNSTTLTVARVEPRSLRVVNAVKTPVVRTAKKNRVVRVNQVMQTNRKVMPAFIFTN